MRIIQIRNSQPLKLVLRSGAFEGYLFWVYAMGWAAGEEKGQQQMTQKKGRTVVRNARALIEVIWQAGVQGRGSVMSCKSEKLPRGGDAAWSRRGSGERKSNGLSMDCEGKGASGSPAEIR